MNKVLSAGIILTDGKNILISHPTNQNRWEIPKGRVDPEDKTRLSAAIREMEEETGLNLSNESFFDAGKFDYTNWKDLYLFVCKRSLEDINPRDLSCTSYFKDDEGNWFPENDSFAIVPIEDTRKMFTKSMHRAVMAALNKFNNKGG